VTGTFSNSTIAINGTEHFNVSYTATGAVLTVVSGAAARSGGLSQSGMVASMPTKPQLVLISSLRNRVGGTPRGSNRFLVAAMRSAGARSGAGAILARDYGLNREESSNHMPEQVAAIWQHKPSVVTPQAQLRLRQGVAPSASQTNNRTNNWSSAVRGSSMRLPVATTSLLRTPMAVMSVRRIPGRIMPPMLPRMGR